MASASLMVWRSTGLARLQELEAVHARATGSQPGRRWGTEQMNRSLFLALVAQFQSYCRDLHDESADLHVTHVAPVQRSLMWTLMTQRRAVDIGTPRRSALGTDFALVGLTLIPDLRARGPQTEADLDALDRLVAFRNAISHGNESEITALTASGQIKATKRSYLEHRRTVERLAGTIDSTVAAGLAALLDTEVPW